jgi:hypothetical protein
MVFYSTSLDEGWDGYYKGKMAEVGNYVYVVEYEGQVKKEIVRTTISGDVTLIR